MRIITVNGKTFSEADYPIETEPSIFAKRRNVQGVGRDTIRITVNAKYSAVSGAFVNGVKWSITEPTPKIIYEPESDAEDAEIIEREIIEDIVYDKSEYSIAGDIVDHRDGRITVYMAKPTEIEHAQTKVAQIMEDIEIILPEISDKTAATVPALFPTWKAGVNYSVGDRCTYGGKLWKVLQAHTSQSDWTPDVAVSLFEKIMA